MLWLYNVLLPTGRLVARAISPWQPKVRAGLAGRRGLQARLAALGAAHPGRVVWIHSASVGEYEQARPLATLLRAARPDLQLLHTFFSPSGYEFARRLGTTPAAGIYTFATAGDQNLLARFVLPRLPHLDGSGSITRHW